MAGTRRMGEERETSVGGGLYLAGTRQSSLRKKMYHIIFIYS